MISQRCKCGEVYHADENHRGKKIQCGRCGHFLTIGEPEARSRSRRPHHPIRWPARIFGSMARKARASLSRHRRLAWLAASGVAAGIVAALIMRESSPPDAGRPATPQAGHLAPGLWGRPESGTELFRSGVPSGPGRLVVENSTTTDALVALIQKTDRLRTRRLVYVRWGSRIVIAGIPAGTYVVRYTLGEDWNTQTRQFVQVVSKQQFVEPFEFTARRDAAGRDLVQTHEVTLFRFTGGSARIQELPPDTPDPGGGEEP